MRQRDQNQLFNQCMAQRAYCMIDEDAAVVKRNNLHIRRKARLNLADLPLDCLNHFPRIGAITDHDYSAHCFLPVFIENAPAKFGTKLHAGHIANRYRRAVVCSKRNVIDVLQAANQADAAHHLLGAANLHHFGADIVIAPLYRGNNILERDVVSAQLDGIEIDLVLLFESAHAGHLGHTGHGVQLVLDEPFLNGMKRAAVVRTLDRIPEDLAHSGCVRPHHRRHACGQKAARQAEPLQHACAREIDVHRILEDHVHHREAERGRRANRAHMRQTLQVHSQRIGNLVFHFLRTAPLPLGKHNHLVFAQIRNRVDGRVHHRPISPHRKRGIDGQNQPAVLHRKFDNAVDHGVFYLALK